MGRGRRKRTRGGPPELERKPTETVSSLPNGAKEEADAERADALDRRIEALRERGETAIKSFLVFLAGAPVLFLFASLLRLLQGPLSKHFGELADPMDKVLSLLDVKPMFALQALTLLLRTADVLRNDRKGNELTLDALDAFYAVAFSIFGFMVGASLMYAVFFGDFRFIIVFILFTVMYSIVYVGLDMLELKLAPFLVHRLYRIVLASIYVVSAASILFIGKES